MISLQEENNKAKHDNHKRNKIKVLKKAERREIPDSWSDGVRRKGPKRGFKKEGAAEVVTFTKYFICSFTESWIEIIKRVITRECGKYSTVVKRYKGDNTGKIK